MRTPNRCPFCDEQPLVAQSQPRCGYYHHPANNCILSGFEIASTDVDNWNRRDLRDPLAVDVRLGDRMYIDSSMQYRNGTLMLTIKREPRESKENPA